MGSLDDVGGFDFTVGKLGMTVQENGLQNKPFTKKHSPFYPLFLLHYAAGLC